MRLRSRCGEPISSYPLKSNACATIMKSGKGCASRKDAKNAKESVRMGKEKKMLGTQKLGPFLAILAS